MFMFTNEKAKSKERNWSLATRSTTEAIHISILSKEEDQEGVLPLTEHIAITNKNKERQVKNKGSMVAVLGTPEAPHFTM